MSNFDISYDTLESKCSQAYVDLKRNNFLFPEIEYNPRSSLPEEQSLSQKQSKTYSFSRIVAKEVGIVPALVLKYLAYKIFAVSHQRDGKLWYYANYRDIAAQFPFLSPSCVDRAINRLVEEKLLELGNYNRRRGDRTRWFSVTQETRNLSDGDLIYFDSKDADIMGYKAAIVFSHLKHVLSNNKTLLKNGKWLRVWPNELALYQPLSNLEAKTSLDKLVTLGFLIRDKAHKSGYWYCLGNIAPAVEVVESAAAPLLFEARPL